MVLTGTVLTNGSRYSRRRVLGAAAGLGAGASALGGCGLFDDGPEPPATPDALQPVLDEALALAAAYDRAAAAQAALSARLTPLAADHRAHAAELAKVIGKPVPSGPAAGATDAASATGPADLLAALHRAEQAAQKTAVAACRQAPADRAALAGSIAACRATHAEALR
jgi:hypothetical protein